MMAEPLVSIRIENRHDNDDQLIEQRVVLREREIAGEHQQGFFAIHFTGMNVRYRQRKELFAFACIRGRSDWRIGDRE